MRLKINGKSDSNQNFDLNSNFPSWRFVRNKVHEEGMVVEKTVKRLERKLREDYFGIWEIFDGISGRFR